MKVSIAARREDLSDVNGSSMHIYIGTEHSWKGKNHQSYDPPLMI